MQAIRTLGRLPKENRQATKDERQLARQVRFARRDGKLSGEEEAELAAMSANDSVMQSSPKPADLQKELSGSSSAKKLVEDVQQVGRSPTRAQATVPGEEEDACGAPQPAASSGQMWTGVEIDPFCQRIFEEQAARSARSRRKAIEDFNWFCGF